MYKRNITQYLVQKYTYLYILYGFCCKILFYLFTKIKVFPIDAVFNGKNIINTCSTHAAYIILKISMENILCTWAEWKLFYLFIVQCNVHGD